MLQSKIDKAFQGILQEYHDNTDCIGDLLAVINPAAWDLSMEEAFIVYMKLKSYIDGDRFFHQYDDNDFICEFDHNEDEWFTIIHNISMPTTRSGHKE